MPQTIPSLVSPTSKVCNHSGCGAAILAGRGYCSSHGGELRLKRELAQLAAAEREQERAERAKRPKFTERGDRRGVVAPGCGLSRFKKPKATPPAGN